MPTLASPTQDLHIAEIAGWRALLTEAQHVARLYLEPALEDYLVRLLFQMIGEPHGKVADDAAAFVERLAQRRIAAGTLVEVANESLLFGGLFPEQAIARGIPIAYFVHVGKNAYREITSQQIEPNARELYARLADSFVTLLDVLHTLRELQQDSPCIDALNAFQLWRELGSSHAWQVLQQFTSGTPMHHVTASTH